MKTTISVFLLFLLMNCMGQTNKDFRKEQLKYKRVKTAYYEKIDTIKKDLNEIGIAPNQLKILLIAFKEEGMLELWVKNTQSNAFIKYKTYEICSSSGLPGPKRQAGDGQVPEGFYVINRFNPVSQFYLSLGIDYPNRSDIILSNADHPGGDIFIHGSCVTIGCIPITDDKIKELYVYAVEAKSNGQYHIPVYIFPAKPGSLNFTNLMEEHANSPQLLSFWVNLKEGYDKFMETKSMLSIIVNEDGRCRFE